ncbi:NADPH-dependent FMN reductase [Afifella marina]|uniref:NAD(P)H-dependent FMN reductase n=1 Tax=Afifella marina DSM 2698 TaxID=1120955 RepID=A0A1G5M2M5_AFIMA|nr:NADPH-dependent FMN reductase [Afifella marina]MBK1623063.1 NAD(P)H-dependent oxidoreductase [Afifella marina DSM 2698]MBK1626057.1 NAD(P)H-dependent oxidoreductase [Afifella marina]MBK5917881.1 NADPH-dependent FMN reductase [Afifella marina]RAI18184.1 NADPH-dependent FMN reductase [Afifella marina DSM 2698]SCZ19433.1 NAD(P)H-dependent FMN reductase [Afifella marina DSM 2698]
MRKIAVLVGSLRRASINRTLAHALEKLGKDEFTFIYPDLNLPLYNDDLWENPPASVLALKRDLAEVDGIIFATPEFNRSIPAVLKNAIDWGSRPYGESSWTGKPISVIGASPGRIGTAAAQVGLRSVLVTQNAFVMGQPEVYLAFPEGLIDGDLAVTDDTTRDFLKEYLARFGEWIDKMPKLGK